MKWNERWWRWKNLFWYLQWGGIVAMFVIMWQNESRERQKDCRTRRRTGSRTVFFTVEHIYLLFVCLISVTRFIVQELMADVVIGVKIESKLGIAKLYGRRRSDRRRMWRWWRRTWFGSKASFQRFHSVYFLVHLYYSWCPTNCSTERWRVKIVPRTIAS